MKTNSLIIAVTFLVTLSACTTSTPYPDDCPAIQQVTQNDCSDLEGHYININDNSVLSDFFNIKVTDLKESSTIELKIENTETLSVTLHHEDKKPQTRELTFSESEFSCEEGVIHFKQNREYFVHQVVLSTSRANIELYSSNLHLIAKIMHKSYTLAMLTLPVKHNNIKWEKWKRVADVSESTTHESE